MKLCEKITFYRKKCGLSQEALAEKIGVSRQAVSKWETGDALPEITKLKSLAECFGVTVDFLLDEEADEYQPSNEKKTKIETTGFDRLIEWMEELPVKLNPFFKKYSWVCGILLILLGVSTIAKGLISLLPTMNMSSHIMSTIAFPFLIIPIINIIFGLLMIFGGVIIIKKTRNNIN